MREGLPSAGCGGPQLDRRCLGLQSGLRVQDRHLQGHAGNRPHDARQSAGGNEVQRDGEELAFLPSIAIEMK